MKIGTENDTQIYPRNVACKRRIGFSKIGSRLSRFIIESLWRTSRIFSVLHWEVAAIIVVFDWWPTPSAMSVPLLGRRRSSSIKKEFSEKELKELRIAFDLLDRNQDGKVTTREFKIMLNNLGIELKEDKVQQLIRSASHAGKELIDENDFLKFVKQIQELCPIRNTKEDDEMDLLAAFKVFDLDNDGFITKDELRIAMEMIGEDVNEEQLAHIMEVADTDKDGKINYKEFIHLLS